MIKRKRSINSIIHDQLLGYASEEDKKQLQSWLDSSQENRENYDRLMREACLYNRQIKKFPTEKQNVSLKHILT